MSRRHRMSRGGSRRHFRVGASRVHPKMGAASFVMRGGHRI